MIKVSKKFQLKESFLNIHGMRNSIYVKLINLVTSRTNSNKMYKEKAIKACFKRQGLTRANIYKLVETC